MKKKSNVKEAKITESDVSKDDINSEIEENKSIQSSNNFKNDNKTIKKFNYTIKDKDKNIIISVILTFTCCLLIFGLFYKFYLKNLVIETTKIQKDVTVTDSGIADAVDKVYDSVVVIENYVNDRMVSSGTGFVFKSDDENGYILTNYHVVEGSKKIMVTFTNDNKIEASLVGVDEYSDIAVLKVDKSNIISIAEIGDADSLRVGDTTFTVGAPLDSNVYSWTVTRGILSGKNRLVEVSIDNNNSVMEVLQTDAAINSGNSGGPLCNSNGQVIGITNMKIASSSIEGMGFAIPIESALKTASLIIEGKSISRPYLGVSIYESNSNFLNNSGIYVEYVESGSSAEKAGLKKGDKIVKIGDKKVTSVSMFRYQLYKYDIGDKVNITIEREGKEKEIYVTLGSSNKIN